MVKPVKPRGGFVYSQPTRCLHCHLVVEMFYPAATDTRTGAWECPQCGHRYPFSQWKIKKKRSPADRAA